MQVWRQPHLGQHLHVPLSHADMVTDEFRELIKETSKTPVEKKKKKKFCEEGERERERDRGRENETEGERARVNGSLRWRFGGGATKAFILLRKAHPHPPPTPTYSDVRVLENYYLNKYIHGDKFETSFFNFFS